MRVLPKLPALLVLLAAPVAAAETPWQTVAPGVTMRLVSAGTVKPDGTTLLGVELDMPANTKTYWRVPGETGLPTQLDFAGSQGVSGDQIIWPYPEREPSERYVDYVYHGPTLLPVQLKLDGAKAQVEVSVVMGVCSDICVPAQAHFSLPVDGAKDMPNGLRIRQAVAMAPIAWDGTSPAIGPVQYRAADQMLAVRLDEPAVHVDSLIVATPDGDPVFGVPQKSPEPNLVLIPVLGKADEINLENRSVQLTFTTDMGAYEVTSPVEMAN
jgi:DsbC/DsbD-like thiol-disulfide interchange protein